MWLRGGLSGWLPTLWPQAMKMEKVAEAGWWPMWLGGRGAEPQAVGWPTWWPKWWPTWLGGRGAEPQAMKIEKVVKADTSVGKRGTAGRLPTRWPKWLGGRGAVTVVDWSDKPKPLMTDQGAGD